MSNITPPVPLTNTPLRILMVEDSPEDAELILYRLNKDGFKVNVQLVQEEGDYLEKLAGPVDLILTDWSLPHFSGLRALQLMHEQGKDIPFVIISGVIGEEAAVAALRQGAYDYLLKDRLHRLGQAVRNALEQKQLRDERKRSEDMLRLQSAALNAAANAIAITLHDGTIEWVNPAFTELTGYTAAEAIGSNFRNLVKSGQHNPALYQNLWETIVSGQIWRGELINRRKNGELYFEEQTITPLRGADGQVERFVAIKQDITLRKRAEKVTAYLYEAGQQLSRTLDLDNLYATLYHFLAGMMDCVSMYISAFEPSDQMIHCVYMMEEGKSVDISAIPPVPLEPEGHGTQSRVIRSKQPLLINDYQNVVHTSQNKHYIDDQGKVVAKEDLPEGADVPRSAIIIPVLLKQSVVSVVQIFSYHLNAYTDEDFKMAEALVAQFAVAINNANLYQQAQMELAERERAEEALRLSGDALRQAYDATLQGWSSALELRERETAGHSTRVVDRTLELARILGVPEEEMTHIQRGAILHDIGKMGIPDDILLKPGKLDENEWEIMRQHPVYAYRLLSQIPFLKPALDIPYAHHERWDGSGYPRKLKGEEIPLSARIFCLVDVWDALSHDRPYNKAWPLEKIMAYIQEQSGKHFDPQVVEVALPLMHRALESTHNR